MIQIYQERSSGVTSLPPSTVQRTSRVTTVLFCSLLIETNYGLIEDYCEQHWDESYMFSADRSEARPVCVRGGIRGQMAS